MALCHCGIFHLVRVDTDSVLEAAERQQEQQETEDTAAVPDTVAAEQDTVLEDTVPVPCPESTAVDSLVFLVPYQSLWCGCCDDVNIAISPNGSLQQHENHRSHKAARVRDSRGQLKQTNEG